MNRTRIVLIVAAAARARKGPRNHAEMRVIHGASPTATQRPVGERDVFRLSRKLEAV